MATKVYLRKLSSLTGTGALGLSYAAPNAQLASLLYSVSTAKGAGLQTVTASTVDGVGAALELAYWISPPLAAAVTISGTITNNIWGLESSMSANATFRVVVKRLSNTGAVGATVSDTSSTSELGTSAAVRNWTDAAPTSTAFAKGDRILVQLCLAEVGTLGSGFTVTADVDGATDAADGDSYVQFNEAVSFMTAPAGSTYYLTDTASDLGGAGQKAAATTRGAGSTNAATTITNGYLTPVQVTATAGGTALEWFTPQLEAFTLAGMVKLNVRAKVAAAGNNRCAVRGEIAVCNSDGTGATVWGAFGEDGTNAATAAVISATDAAQVIWVAGADVSVTAGQRIRARLYMDDSVVSAAAAATPLTVSYSGTSGGAAGDTFVVLPQTVTETGGGNTYTKAGFGRESAT